MRTGPSGSAIVAKLCKTLIVQGSCGDPNCGRRHDSTEKELSMIANSKAGRLGRATISNNISLVK
jgi:hypothetical protein